MSGWTKAREAIVARQRVGTQVLVVEGEDDRLFVEAMLDKIAPGVWPARWTIGEAGGKGHVLSILREKTDWLALVDRDEWSATDIAEQQAEFPARLFILPRYCMESYFILPAEVWASIPTQQQHVGGGFSILETAIHSTLPQWLRHGCLWHAVNPLQDGLRALGFKDALLDLGRAQNDADIRQTLQDWHQYLDPVRIESEFRANLAAAQMVPVDERIKIWVHGKKFFEQHVVPELNQLLGQSSAKKWLTELRKDMPPPNDLAFLWNAMGLP
jgi:hypothetical protein